MSDTKSDPPKQAIWFLQHACPGDNQALTGDLIERFGEGQTRAWFWRQVLIAFATSVLSAMRRRWPYFCYAIGGTAIPFFLWKAVDGVPSALHWWALPWPLSQFAFEWARGAMLALAALPVLAAGLLVTREFRWASLFRTALINLTLFTLGHYLLGCLAVSPWLSPLVVELAFFSGFLVSAWLGCRSPRNTGELAVTRR